MSEVDRLLSALAACIDDLKEWGGLPRAETPMPNPYPYDSLLHVMYASTTAPSWAVLDWGMGEKPEARIVAMFYTQPEASEYSAWRRKGRIAASLAAEATNEGSPVSSDRSTP